MTAYTDLVDSHSPTDGWMMNEASPPFPSTTGTGHSFSFSGGFAGGQSSPLVYDNGLFMSGVTTTGSANIDQTIDSSTAFTVNMWVDVRFGFGDSVPLWLGTIDTTGLGFKVDIAGAVFTPSAVTSDADVIGTGPDINTAIPHMLTITHIPSPEKLEFYVDGVSQGYINDGVMSGSPTTATSDINVIVMGAINTFPTALSAAEVEELFLEGAGPLIRVGLILEGFVNAVEGEEPADGFISLETGLLLDLTVNATKEFVIPEAGSIAVPVGANSIPI